MQRDSSFGPMPRLSRPLFVPESLAFASRRKQLDEGQLVVSILVAIYSPWSDRLAMVKKMTRFLMFDEDTHIGNAGRLPSEVRQT